MNDIALDFLTSLEAREARLLTWGFVDGGFLDEVIELADRFVIERDETGTMTGAELVRSLRQQAVLLEVRAGGPFIYRTRMAETVRLLSRLRQLFPKHQRTGWATAPSLVADYRLLTRPRSFPRRDISVPDALSHLDKALGANPERRAILQRLLQRGGAGAERFQVSRFQLEATARSLAASTPVVRAARSSAPERDPAKHSRSTSRR